MSFADGKASGVITLPEGVSGTFVWAGKTMPLHPGTSKIAFAKTTAIQFDGIKW